LNRIANGGRVSNPVPGNGGLKAGIALVTAELRRTWSAEIVPVANMLKIELDLSLDAM